jgi:hypothetical protein
MSVARTVHVIGSNCEVYISQDGPQQVRVRITEDDPELVNPTDFEIEGDATHIGEALATAAVVIQKMKAEYNKEPN